MPSTFTAINHSPLQLITPQSSVTPPVQQNEARRRATSKRHHNSAVAQYLGFGNLEEPAHLEKYAPLPAGYTRPKSSRKRRKLATVDNSSHRPRNITNGEPDISKQFLSQVIQRPVLKPAADQLQVYSNDSLSPSSPQTVASQTLPLQTLLKNIKQSQSTCYAYHTLGQYRKAAASRVPNEEMMPGPDPLNHIESSPFCEPGHSDHPGSDPWQHIDGNTVPDEDDFDCGILDEDFLDLMHETDFTLSMYPSKSTDNLQGRVGKQVRPSLPGVTPKRLDVNTSQNHSHRSSTKFKSPLTLTSRLLAITGDVEKPDARKPIVRPPFPIAVRDRSPIIGLSSNTLLRTCFRIGEIINQCSQMLRTGKAVIFELYARVLESERTDMQQTFTFCDLFHAKPPHVKGTYHATIWASVQLFEYDASRLLQKGRICRCIGTMKRVDREWVMTILNIWEATWEDVQWVQGIVEL